MNTRNLIRWSGLSAIVAGSCFTIVGLLHPPDVLSSVTTTEWAITHYLAIAMSLFGLLGITGLYARQAENAGWLGLAGYLLWSLWLMLTLPFTFFEAFVLPQLVTEAPAFTEGFLGIFGRSTGETNVGVLAGLWALADILFLLGGLLFGIATLRAGVIARWAAGAFTVGIGLAPASALLPPETRPLVAVPIGLGLALLGWVLWSERREQAADVVSERGSALLRPTVAE